MEAFLGTWQVDLASTTGLEEFGKAMGFTQEMADRYKTLDYSVNFSTDGEVFNVDADFKGTMPAQNYKLKLGEAVDYQSPHGFTAKLTLTFEDGKSVENYEYAEKNAKWKVTRSVEGNVMTAVTTAGDASMTQKLNKV